MQKMMAKKVWSIQIFNILMIISFIFWLGSLKYLHDAVTEIGYLESRMFLANMDKINLDFTSEDEDDINYNYDDYNDYYDS